MILLLDFDETITKKKTSDAHGALTGISEITEAAIQTNLRNCEAMAAFIKARHAAGDRIAIVTLNGRTDVIEKYLAVLLGDEWNAYVTIGAAGSPETVKEELLKSTSDKTFRSRVRNEHGKTLHILKALLAFSLLGSNGDLLCAPEEIVVLDDNPENCRGARKKKYIAIPAIENETYSYLNCLAELSRIASLTDETKKAQMDELIVKLDGVIGLAGGAMEDTDDFMSATTATMGKIIVVHHPSGDASSSTDSCGGVKLFPSPYVGMKKLNLSIATQQEEAEGRAVSAAKLASPVLSQKWPITSTPSHLRRNKGMTGLSGAGAFPQVQVTKEPEEETKDESRRFGH